MSIEVIDTDANGTPTPMTVSFPNTGCVLTFTGCGTGGKVARYNSTSTQWDILA
jgi:hypothetical protein